MSSRDRKSTRTAPGGTRCSTAAGYFAHCSSSSAMAPRTCGSRPTTTRAATTGGSLSRCFSPRCPPPWCRCSASVGSSTTTRWRRKRMRRLPRAHGAGGSGAAEHACGPSSPSCTSCSWARCGGKGSCAEIRGSLEHQQHHPRMRTFLIHSMKDSILTYLGYF